MAQEVTLMGATYSDVPSILLPDSNSTLHQFTDVTGTTATASDVASGKVFFASDGTQTTGTASGGGGSSSWTLVASTSYQVSTTSTSNATVATWETGDSSIWTSDKIVYVRIRDTAGKRAGYFYGSDNFFINHYPANANTSSTSLNLCIKYVCRYTSDSEYGQTTSAYGVWADYIYSDGRIRIRSRYNSTYSLTINGTYSVQVYLLAPPTNAPIFT